MSRARRSRWRRLIETTDLSRTIEAQAAQWLARLQSEERCAGDIDAWEAWIAADPRHAEAFERITLAWERSHEALRDRRRPAPLRRLDRRTLLAAGAASVAVLGAGLVWATARGNYKTGIGERRSIPLADGSVALLDSHTRLTVDMGAQRREITLLEGRAYFDVKPDPLRPFVVRAAGRQVIAVGTAFEVAVEQHRVSVCLLKGKVAVEPSDRQILYMDAGQRMVFEQDRPVTSDWPDLDSITAWHQGKLIFNDTTLADAMAQLNRYSRRQLHADPILESIRISGVFANDDPEAFARSVALLFHCRVIVTDAQISLATATSAPSDRGGRGPA